MTHAFALCRITIVKRSIYICREIGMKKIFTVAFLLTALPCSSWAAMADVRVAKPQFRRSQSVFSQQVLGPGCRTNWLHGIGQGSRNNWLRGIGPGSRQFWLHGIGPGSRQHWLHGFGPLSRQNWFYGFGEGSRQHWLHGVGSGSRQHWLHGVGPGSRQHWLYGVGPGTRNNWLYGFGPGRPEEAVLTMCLGLKEENDMPEMCEAYPMLEDMD